MVCKNNCWIPVDMKTMFVPLSPLKGGGLSIEKHVEIDERFFRPNEVPYLLGDSSKAQEALGWKPKVDLKQLAQMMYDSDWNEMCKISGINRVNNEK